MLRETTVTADTVEEAKQKACQELGAAMEKIQFEILRQPEKKNTRTVRRQSRTGKGIF